jgi:hypothetical protein
MSEVPGTGDLASSSGSVKEPETETAAPVIAKRWAFLASVLDWRSLAIVAAILLAWVVCPSK